MKDSVNFELNRLDLYFIKKYVRSSSKQRESNPHLLIGSQKHYRYAMLAVKPKQLRVFANV